MWLLLTSYLRSKALVIAGWGAVVLAVLGVLLGVRNAGKQAVKVDIMKEALKVKHAQQKAAASGPRDKPGLIDELRRGKF
jgi:hypothetical protein